jgi:hypothetical protein
MGVSDNTTKVTNLPIAVQKFKKLNLEQIKQIDDALATIGEYGEVRLILQHGELRYINKVESQKAWKNCDHSN